jgi:hypothetical protein
MRIRSYSELQDLATFEERFTYLSLGGVVGEATFGFDRWLNQQFYTSKEWRDTRVAVITRDNGCDLGIDGYEIFGGLKVHHMNPLTPKAIELGESWILDPEFLITTTHNTHNAIHYGNEQLLVKPFKERTRGDTKLW